MGPEMTQGIRVRILYVVQMPSGRDSTRRILASGFMVIAPVPRRFALVTDRGIGSQAEDLTRRTIPGEESSEVLLAS